MSNFAEKYLNVRCQVSGCQVWIWQKCVKVKYRGRVSNHYSWSEAGKVVTLHQIQVDLQDQSLRNVMKHSEKRKESVGTLLPNAENGCVKGSEKRWQT